MIKAITNFLLLLLLLPLLLLHAQDRVALVIGNSGYAGNLYLNNPLNDAQAVAAKLQAIGFQVTLKTDADFPAMGQALWQFGTKIKKDSIALFYYAGHAVEVDGQNYLIPLKCRVQGPAELSYLAINSGQVLAKMRDRKCLLSVMILDSCRNNPYRGIREFGQSSGLAAPKGAMPKGSLIVYATALGKTADDGTGKKHSPFTEQLLRYLDKPEKVLNLFNQVSDAVAVATSEQQQPWISSSRVPRITLGQSQSPPKPTGDRYEPNDSRDQARVLVPGSHRGLRIAKGDRDWYVTDKAGDEELQVRIDFRHSAGDLDMKVYGPGETKEGKSSDDNEEIKMIGPAGSYRIEVYGYKDAANDYDLTIARRQLTPIPKPTPTPKPTPPSPGGSYGLPEDVWTRCNYQHDGHRLLDMTGEYWANLSASDQQRYAAQYQRGYATSVGQPVEKTFSGGGTEMVMRLIPPGRYWMGSPDSEKERDSDESPRHRVVISRPYWLGKYEVTQGQWQAVMGSNPASFTSVGSNAPVEKVSWEQCQQFCTKTGGRLPSEGEWEYACRAGTTTPFNLGGNITPAQVNYDGNYPYDGAAKGEYRQKTVVVGSLASPNAWGCHDMSGNVYEWCQDWKKDYSAQDQSDPTGPPTGPPTGSFRVCRGGCWSNFARNCRSALRRGNSPGLTDIYFGFRAARSL